MGVMSFRLGVFSLEFITLFIGFYVAESQVTLTSQYNGTSVPGDLGSSVTFTWNFTGEVFTVTFGTKQKDTASLDDKLLRLTASGSEFYNVTEYNGRVSGKWKFKSPGQVSFTLSAIKEIDNRLFISNFQPKNFLVNPVVDIVQLNVQGLPEASFISRYLTIETGGNATFTCKASGFPTPNVIWKRGFSEFVIQDDNEKYQVYSRSGSSELIIRSATVDDHGFYICEASNFRSDRARAYLGVLSSYVDDDMCPKSIDATIGESRTICCPVKGHPPPHIFWQVPNGTSHNSDDVTLSVVLRTNSDFGVYRCLARGLEKDIEQVVTIRKKVLQPIIDTENVTTENLKPGDKFFWTAVPEAVEYYLRISETISTKAISLLGSNITSVEIPYSSLVFKSKNEDERPRMVNVTIEVEAIGKSGFSGRRVPHKVVIHASATTFTVSSMTLMLLFVFYNLQ